MWKRAALHFESLPSEHNAEKQSVLRGQGQLFSRRKYIHPGPIKVAYNRDRDLDRLAIEDEVRLPVLGKRVAGRAP